MKHIILLNGPSSSGKSTLSRTLQAQLLREGQEYPWISIDHFLNMSTDEVIYEDDVYAICPALCQAVETALETAPGVIIDQVITSRRIFDHLCNHLAAHRIHLIRVTCPVEILRQRELARKNRCLGSAEASQIYLYPQEGYHLTVDTYAMTPQECAARIYETIF